MTDRSGPRHSEAEAIAMFDELSNAGRWGTDDELGTLNLITSHKRLAAAALVNSGTTISIGRNIDLVQSGRNTRPAVHLMITDMESVSATDWFGLVIHGFGETHVDATGHMYWEDRLYNDRRKSEVLSSSGLSFGSVLAQGGGIVTRAVFLDIASARGLPFLAPTEYVYPEDLDEAERLSGTRVVEGDAVIVRVGVEEREAVEGPEDVSTRAGLDVSCVPWLRDRGVALYAGDCIERLPFPYDRFIIPFHILTAALGLPILDNPRLADLTRHCQQTGRFEMMFVVAPLRIPGGTGSPVNPICIF